MARRERRVKLVPGSGPVRVLKGGHFSRVWMAVRFTYAVM